MVEDANTYSAGDNKACFNGRGGKNKCSSGKGIGIGTGNGSSQKRPLCNGGGQKKELLYLQRIWAHSLSLRESEKRKSNGRKKSGIWRRKVRGQYQTNQTFKRGGELRSPQLSSYNNFNVLDTEINTGILKTEGTEKKMEIRKMEGKTLREVTVKIRLERIDTQEGIMVEVLLDSGATGLVMSSEFAKKQGFKLKKLERPMNVRNIDGSMNKEGPIEHTVEVNIYFKRHRERTEINVIGRQK